MIVLDKDTFDPFHTFTCGQCFRWWSDGSRWYGIVKGCLIAVSEEDCSYDVRALAGDLEDKALSSYFDVQTPYRAITDVLRRQDHWLEAAVDYGKGIRLLRQDPLEMLLTFIVSSNNNIPKIKMTVEALCEAYGQPIQTPLGVKHAFPTLEALSVLTEEDFKVKSIGYRSKAVYKAVRRLCDEGLDLNKPFELGYEDGKAWLMQFYGIGEKVADCILLFAYGKPEAFPLDTWVKRMLRELYGVKDKQKDYEAFIGAYFNQYGGYAQQYLFHYIRHHHLDKGE